MEGTDTVVYVANTDDTATEGAEALEAAAPRVDVVPASNPEAVSAHAPEAACVVFAETPTTAAGASLLDVVEAAEGTPLILFSDSSFGAAMAHSTDGVTDYVRKDTEAAVSHLADAVAWTCRGDRGDEQASAGVSENGDPGREPDRDPDPDEDESPTGGDPGRDVSLDGDAATSDSLDWRSLARTFVAADDVDAIDEAVLETVRTATAAEHVWIAADGGGGWTITVRHDAPAADDRSPSDTLLAAISAGTEPAALGGPPTVESVPDPGTLASTLDTDRDGANPVPAAGSGSVVAASIDRESALFVWFEAVEDPPDEAISTIETITEPVALARTRSRRLGRSERAAAQLGTDLTEAKRVEAALADEIDALEAGTDALEAERDRFRSWFRTQPEPALAFAIEDGRAVCWAASEGFEAAFDLDRDRVRGEPLCDVLAILDAGTDGLAIRADLLDPIVSGNTEDPIVWRCETVDGVREVELDVSHVEGAPTFAGEGRGGASVDEREPNAADPPSTGVLQFRDVTERRRTERELAATRERLESVGDLLEDDARPSLNVARGYLELAEETGERTEFAEVEDAHESIGETLDHLARIVGRDADIIEAEPITLFDLARQAWVAVEPVNARLELERNARFTGDRDRLRAVVEHVITVATAGGENEDGTEEADSATAEAADAADSATGPESEGAVVSIGATDDGFYIAGNTVEEAPDALTETPAAGDGTGIRLGLVERVAQAHGWRVGIAEGESGTAFAFRGVETEDAE